MTNIETYSQDTFPPLNDYLEGDKIPLKRHAISFQLAGNFLKIGSFMETLEKTSTDLRLEHCSFSLDDKEKIAITLDNLGVDYIDCLLYTSDAADE